MPMFEVVRIVKETAHIEADNKEVALKIVQDGWSWDLKVMKEYVRIYKGVKIVTKHKQH